jgi:hypothetical protein
MTLHMHVPAILRDSEKPRGKCTDVNFGSMELSVHFAEETTVKRTHMSLILSLDSA